MRRGSGIFLDPRFAFGGYWFVDCLPIRTRIPFLAVDWARFTAFSCHGYIASHKGQFVPWFAFVGNLSLS